MVVLEDRGGCIRGQVVVDVAVFKNRLCPDMVLSCPDMMLSQQIVPE